MKKLFLRSSLVFSILMLISPCNQVNSCFFEAEWGDTRMVFFNPDLGNDSLGLKPFFYSYYYLFPTDYDGFSDVGEENENNDYRRNCLEWQAYLGKQVDLEDIDRVIYGSSADSFSTALKTNTLHEFLPGNTFLKALQKPQHGAALQYLDFAKRMEFQQFESGSDPWDESRYYPNWNQPDTSMLDRLGLESAEQLAKASDPFLRQRWAYQRINVLYYQGNADSTASMRRIFDNYFDLKRDKTVLLPWALLKIAEVTPDEGLHNYYLATVFDRCQSKRIRAVQLFHSATAAQALPHARTAQEKTAILAMRAMQRPGRELPALRQVAAISAQSPYLPLLLTREINKVESWLLTSKLSGQEPWHAFEPDYEWDENYDRKMDRWRRINAEKDRLYLQELRTFVAQVNAKQSGRSPVKPFLQLALAHLYYLENRPQEAWQVLQKIAPNGVGRWELQKKIQEVLLLPQRADVRTPATQTALYERLDYIRRHAALLTEAPEQLSRIYLVLSHAFWAKKDIVHAGLLFGRASEYTATYTEHWWDDSDALGFYDNFATIPDMEALEKLLAKKQKTPFEQFITQPYQGLETVRYASDWSSDYRDTYANAPIPGTEDIHELMGTFALRDGDLKRAYAEFAQIDSSYWNENGDVWSVDLCGAANLIAADTLPPLPGNNKTMIVKKMLDLEEEAARNPAKRAENYYLLGNAWFHCSYWGRANDLLTRHSSVYETDQPSGKKRSPAYLESGLASTPYRRMYYRCARAAAYFQRALDAKPAPDLGARAFYMLAECDRRDRWMTMRRNPKGPQEGGVTSPLFRTWAQRYRNTMAYRECLEACPDLKVYLGK